VDSSGFWQVERNERVIEEMLTYTGEVNDERHL